MSEAATEKAQAIGPRRPKCKREALIREAVLRDGLTMADAARAMGLSRNGLYRLFESRNPWPRTLQRMVRWLRRHGRPRIRPEDLL